MWLRRDLKAALLGDSKLSQLRERAEQHEAVWGWSYDVTGADVISRQLVEAYLGHVTARAPGRDLPRPLTLTDVSQRLSSVEALADHLKARATALENKMGKLGHSFLMIIWLNDPQ